MRKSKLTLKEEILAIRKMNKKLLSEDYHESYDMDEMNSMEEMDHMHDMDEMGYMHDMEEMDSMEGMDYSMDMKEMGDMHDMEEMNYMHDMDEESQASLDLYNKLVSGSEDTETDEPISGDMGYDTDLEEELG